MYRNHMGGQLAQMRIHCDELKAPSRSGSATIPGLSGSASVKEKTLTVTLTNPSLDAPRTARIHLTSGNIVESRGTLLTHENMMAGNTLDRPKEVQSAALPVNLRGNNMEITIPRHAIVSLELKLA
jgi:alpha-N-arabinofuranosidase